MLSLIQIQKLLNYNCSSVSCPCVLILTLLDLIVCTVVNAGIFKCIGVSFMFAIVYNS